MKSLTQLFAILLFLNVHYIDAQELALIRQNDLFGYIDNSGQYVIEPQFEKADSFSDGLAPALKDDKWGFIDKSGNWSIKAAYDRVKAFNSGYALVLKDDKWNYINGKGEILHTPVTDKFYDFQEGGIAFFRKEDKVGLINTSGKVVLEPKYSEIKPFHNGHAKVREDDLWGLINSSGKETVPVLYEEIGNYSKNGIWARKGDVFGIFVDSEFKEIEGVDKIWDFPQSSTLTYARSNKKIGFINNIGNWVVEPIYQGAKAFNKGYAPVSIKNKWGYIDENGKQLVDFIYKDAEVFSNDGLAAVKVKRWGFITTEGTLVIPMEYDITAGFSFFDKNQQKGFINGLARVKYNKQWGFLKKDGEVLGDKWFQNAELFCKH
ncbi:WG repeat-containing protein [Galbibacter sp. PAP.153]|uniref:WG repeat-containing protein n=1 Tax=Galbibacter sp. PAP.153 TaxID=3104623 RepID=UPI003009C2C2